MRIRFFHIPSLLVDVTWYHTVLFMYLSIFIYYLSIYLFIFINLIHAILSAGVAQVQQFW